MRDENARYRIVADLMASGAAVAEGYLYGSEAVHLIKNKLVSRDVITSYRSNAYFERVRMYGVDAAKRWEDERKAFHADCWQNYDKIMEQRKEMEDMKAGRNRGHSAEVNGRDPSGKGC